MRVRAYRKESIMRRITEEQWLNFWRGVGSVFIGMALFATAPEPAMRRASYIFYVVASIFVLMGGAIIWGFLAPMAKHRIKKGIRKMRAMSWRRQKPRRAIGSKKPAPALPALEDFSVPSLTEPPVSQGLPEEPTKLTKQSHAEWERVLNEIRIMRQNAHDPDSAQALANIEKEMQESRHRKPGTARYLYKQAKAISKQSRMSGGMHAAPQDRGPHINPYPPVPLERVRFTTHALEQFRDLYTGSFSPFELFSWSEEHDAILPEWEAERRARHREETRYFSFERWRFVTIEKCGGKILLIITFEEKLSPPNPRTRLSRRERRRQRQRSGYAPNVKH